MAQTTVSKFAEIPVPQDERIAQYQLRKTARRYEPRSGVIYVAHGVSRGKSFAPVSSRGAVTFRIAVKRRRSRCRRSAARCGAHPTPQLTLWAT